MVNLGVLDIRKFVNHWFKMLTLSTYFTIVFLYILQSNRLTKSHSFSWMQPVWHRWSLSLAPASVWKAHIARYVRALFPKHWVGLGTHLWAMGTFWSVLLYFVSYILFISRPKSAEIFMNLKQIQCLFAFLVISWRNQSKIKKLNKLENKCLKSSENQPIYKLVDLLFSLVWDPGECLISLWVTDLKKCYLGLKSN